MSAVNKSNSDVSDDPTTMDKASASGAPEKSERPSTSSSRTKSLPVTPEEKKKRHHQPSCAEEEEAPSEAGAGADGEETTASSRARDGARKLEARLEQAKQSLASPHISAAVDAYVSLLLSFC